MEDKLGLIYPFQGEAEAEVVVEEVDFQVTVEEEEVADLVEVEVVVLEVAEVVVLEVVETEAILVEEGAQEDVEDPNSKEQE